MLKTLWLWLKRRMDIVLTILGILALILDAIADLLWRYTAARHLEGSIIARCAAGSLHCLNYVLLFYNFTGPTANSRRKGFDATKRIISRRTRIGLINHGVLLFASMTLLILARICLILSTKQIIDSNLTYIVIAVNFLIIIAALMHTPANNDQVATTTEAVMNRGSKNVLDLVKGIFLPTASDSASERRIVAYDLHHTTESREHGATSRTYQRDWQDLDIGGDF